MKRLTVDLLMIKVFIGLITLSMVGCNKDNDENAAYRESAKDQAEADILFSDVFNQVNLASGQLEYDLFGPGSMKSTDDGGCATISISPFDTLNWPKTLEVDFGDTNCQGVDGKYRRGMINAVLTGRYRDSLTIITISPENYYVDDYKVEGLKTVTNLGHITDGKMTFAVAVQNAVITNPDGEEFRWSSERTKIWVEGEATAWPIVMDDVFEISGESSGTTYKNLNFFIQTTEPLRVERDCEWIVSGELEVTPEGYDTRTLNYGDGNCDNKATLTVNGETYQITLP